MTRNKEILNIDQIKSAVWQSLKRHIEERVEHLRKLNDQDHDDRKTANIRGGIKELKGLIKSIEPRETNHDR